MKFDSEKIAINGVYLVQSPTYLGHDAQYTETFRLSEMKKVGLNAPFAIQAEFTASKGFVYGLSLQTPPEGQRCSLRALQGDVWAVVADVRPNSTTFKYWFGVKLTEKDSLQSLFTPEGCAVGFVVLSDQATLQWSYTKEQSWDHRISIRWDDPDLAVLWPLPRNEMPEPLETDMFLRGVILRLKNTIM